MKTKDIIWTIEDLYNWACKKGVQNYTCFADEEGCSRNLYESEIIINEEEGWVYL